MTEQEWLTGVDPQEMLSFVRGEAGDRRLRLFAVACCRLIGQLFLDERIPGLLDTCEHAADAEDTEEDRARIQAWSADQHFITDGVGVVTEVRTRWAGRDYAAATLNLHAFAAVQSVLDWDEATIVDGDGERPADAHFAAGLTAFSAVEASGQGNIAERAECSLLRDIFGNPFRPATADPRWPTPNVIAFAQATDVQRTIDRLPVPLTAAPPWLTPNVIALVHTIYHDRALDRLPMLADALEEAGCDDADILCHCRGPGPHVRGCWVVDLLLGRE
jgi:hypothetical protein